MNFDEFVKKYNLLQDKEGKWYYIDEKTGIRKEPFATIAGLAKLFNVSDASIERRIKNKPINTYKLKMQNGQIRQGYSVNDAKMMCADLLNITIHMNISGIAIVNNQEIATIPALEKKLKLSATAIKSRIKKHNIKKHKVKLFNGFIANAYNVQAVTEACNDLSEKVYPANKQGYAIIDGEEYATSLTLSKKLGIAFATIQKKAIKNNVRIIKIKPLKGGVRIGYNVKEVEKACKYLLKETPAANSSGIVMINGKKYATIHFLSITFDLSINAVKKRIIQKKLKAKKIKVGLGILRDGYEIEEAQKACADLLQKIPKANKQGYVKIKGQKFAPILVIAKTLNLSHITVKQRIEKAALESYKIIDRARNITLAYNIKLAEVACSDLLDNNLLIVDKKGWATKDGQRYASIQTIADELGISYNLTSARLKDYPTCKGKILSGRITDLYNFQEAQIACAELLNDNLLIPNHKGWATKDSQRYAAIGTFAKHLGLSHATIEKRVKNLTAVKGMRNRVTNFYNFDDVKDACADLLDDKLLIADKNGWAIKDGKKYATIRTISLFLQISETAIRARIKNLVTIKGKTRTGQIVDFYNFEEVKSVCADLLEKKKKRKKKT